MRCINGRLLLEGEMSMDTVPSLLSEVRELCAGQTIDTVDFAGVGLLDSAAIAMALELRRIADRELRFENLPPSARKLASLYAVADQLGLED